MPGLYGFARIDPAAPRDPHRARATLDAMCARLAHHDEYVTASCIDAEGGFAIARTGLPGQHEQPWMRAVSSRGAYTQIAGALHVDGGLSCEVRRAEDVERALRNSRGSFAAVVRHPGSGDVTIAVDHRASWPSFYTVADGYLYFAPEVKALLDVPGVDLSVDPAALGLFLGSGYLPAARTQFAHIHRLPGGHALHVSAGAVREHAYWTFRPGTRVGRDAAALREELVHAIEGAVARHMGDPTKTVVFLSGGVDSRAILTGALHAVDGDGRALEAVTWGSDFERPGSDVEVARDLASQTGLNLRLVRRESDRYGEQMRRANYLIDGLSDVAAAHPHELTIMESLRAAGFNRVLRGDQSFGWRRSTDSTEGAVLELGFRWLRHLPAVAALVTPELREPLVAETDRALEALAAAGDGAPLDDFKDALYFEQRLQGYLNTAAMFKQAVVDHRAPLLDREVLDVVEEIPGPGRLNKAWLREALAEHSPVGRVPYATTSNLENWGWVLDHETPLRHYAQEQFADASAGIWQYLDRSAAATLLSRPADTQALRKRTGWATLKPMLRDAAFRLAPGTAARLRTSRQRHAVERSQLVMRVLALKHWHEAFVESPRRDPVAGH